MVILSRVKQATSEFIKILRYGKEDVQTSEQYLPFGIDSKPVVDIMAAQSKTTDSGETVILGYLIESEETEPGETRIYATDSGGAEAFSVLFKNDGTCEFGGTVDNFVRYLKLNIGLQQQVIDINVELVKIATGITGAGGAYTPTPISLDISDSKIEEIKTL